MPESYRAAVVKRSEVDMFEGMESPDKDPRKRSTSTRCHCPSWRPTRPTSR